MVGEKQLHPSLANSVDYALSGGDNEPWHNSGWDDDCLRTGGTEGDPVPDETGFYGINVSGGGLAPDSEHPDATTIRSRVKDAMWWSHKFGASHPEGANFVMADGSVRVIGFTIDPEEFLRSCVIDEALLAVPE
jgi:prepilin-type processing-associated H-X9-DG protein